MLWYIPGKYIHSPRSVAPSMLLHNLQQLVDNEYVIDKLGEFQTTPQHIISLISIAQIYIVGMITLILWEDLCIPYLKRKSFVADIPLIEGQLTED